MIVLKKSRYVRYGVLLLVLAAVALALMVGCSRHIDSKNPVRSVPAAPPQPVNVTATLGDRSVLLDWDVSDTSNVDRFRVYSSPAGEDTYTLRDSATTDSLTITGLPLNESLDMQVRAVSARDVEGEGSTPVTVTIGVLSIRIANNNEYTNTRSVQIQLNAPATAAYVELSEDAFFSDASPVQFASQLPFMLSANDGLKRVFARFTFTDGSMSTGKTADNITLDTDARINSVYFEPMGETFTTGDTIRFFVDANGESGGEATVSFGNVSNYRLNDGGQAGDATANDGLYSGRYIVPVGVTVNSGEVHGDFTDAAGNHAAQALASQGLDIKATPQAVQLASVEAVTSWQVTLRWTQSGSSDFDVYRVYRNTDAGVTDSSSLITSVEQQTTISYTDTTVDANTQYFYRVYVIDNSGLKAGSNVDSVTTPANQPPQSVTAAATLQDSTHAQITWTRNEDDDFGSYRIYRDTSPGVSVADDQLTIISDRGTLSFTDYVPFPVGNETYYYRVMVYDRQGLMTSSNEVQVSR